MRHWDKRYINKIKRIKFIQNEKWGRKLSLFAGNTIIYVQNLNLEKAPRTKKSVWQSCIIQGQHTKVNVFLQ